MKLGIVGLPNVGKSTLFNSLTKAGALSANYPFATIDPNVGIVSVPDERIVKLGELYHTKKVMCGQRMLGHLLDYLIRNGCDISTCKCAICYMDRVTD